MEFGFNHQTTIRTHVHLGLELAAGVGDYGRQTAHELGPLLRLHDAVTSLERDRCWLLPVLSEFVVGPPRCCYQS